MPTYDNSIGAIPLVITLSHSVSQDKIPSVKTFLKNWYAQIVGNKNVEKGQLPFNLTSENYLFAAPDASGSQTIQSNESNLYSLDNLAWNGNGSITPYLPATTTAGPSYNQAYSAAKANLADVFSGSNPDIRVDASNGPIFPVFWLSGLQSAALILSSGNPKDLNGTNPIPDLVNNSGGAPAPTDSSLNYVIHEAYYGPNAANADDNNGDATYIEQFSIPNSLILWYTDSSGNLYRGIKDNNGDNLSIPGTGSFTDASGNYDPSYNNASSLSRQIAKDFAAASVFSNTSNGTLYANPKDTFANESNAILDPAFGDYYAYQYWLQSQDSSGTLPISWTNPTYKDGNGNWSYTVNSITYSGFDDPSGNPLAAFDGDARVQLNISYNNLDASGSPDGSGNASIIIPWFGYDPRHTKTQNQYQIVATGSGESGIGPTGGWTVAWVPSYTQVWMGSNSDTSTNLNALSDTTPVSVNGGTYGANNLFQYYGALFQYDPSSSSFKGQSFTYTQDNKGPFTATGDTITAYRGFTADASGVWGNSTWLDVDASGSPFSVTVNSGTPDTDTSGNLTLGGSSSTNTKMNIRYDASGNSWQIMIPASQGWNTEWQGIVTQWDTFSVPGGGLLPSNDSTVSVTVQVNAPPSVPITPTPLPWTNLIAANGAVLQAMVDASGHWLLQGDPGSAWNGSGQGMSFGVPGGGLLPNGFQPTFTLAKAPDAKATSDQVGLIFSANQTDFTAPSPITAFTASDPSGNPIATLTLNNIWKANQLFESSDFDPSGFTYAASPAGIAGANAGSYTVDSSGQITQIHAIANTWDSGGVVGDYLALLNAGLLGATGEFNYNGQQSQIGNLYSLQDPSGASPWFDKINGPVAKGFFGEKAWATQDASKNYWNTWSSLLNQYAPNVYTFGLSDRFGNNYDINLNLDAIDPSGGLFLQYDPSGTSPESAFQVVSGNTIEGDLYPLFIEYQIGGFGQSQDPSGMAYDFLPDYNNTRSIVTVPTPQGEQRIRVEFNNGQLRDGTDLQILSSLGLSQATLQQLAQLGVRLNSTGIAVELDTTPGDTASLNADSQLVAADLLSQLSDGSQRLLSRKLLCLGLDASGGTVSPLTFDPITGTGGRFFDLNNDSVPDFFTLSLRDQSGADRETLPNGMVDAASVSGVVDLPDLGFSRQRDGLLTASDPANSATAGVGLRAQLTSRSDRSNQIGYVVLSPEELASAETLLQDPAWLRSRAKVLFSTLEASDVTLPTDSRFERDIALINGQSLRFFAVEDGSLDQLSSLSDARFRYLEPDSVSREQVTFASPSGVGFSLSLLDQDPGLNVLVSQPQSQAPLLDLTPLRATQSLQGNAVLSREAELNSVAGFYRTLDIQGRVLSSDGLTSLRPGDPGYAEAALRPDNLVTALGDLSVGDDQVSQRDISISGPGYLAPFAQVNDNTFFAYAAANSDGFAHFASLGDNKFGLEDLPGGGDKDFDDLIISCVFNTVI